MSRSTKKGPFVQEVLLKRIKELNEKKEKLESKIKMKDYLTEKNDKSSSSINEFNINIEDYLETDLNDVVFEEIKERGVLS